jgi:hypothetical protein
MKSSNENNLQGIYQNNIKRGIGEGNDTRLALGDITNSKRCISTGIKRKKIESANLEVELFINPSPQKVARSNNKEIVDQNREGETIEILSSGDEDEEITPEIALKPTLHQLAPIDLASVANKNHLMRGTCVQTVAELLHSEKRREDLTCVSTDLYSLIMENKFTQAKKLLHPDEGCEVGRDTNWNMPRNRIATARSRILLIPCHTGNHWFRTIRIKQAKGKHQVIIIDSLGKESGDKYVNKIREGLKRMKLIAHKVRCHVFDTEG